MGDVADNLILWGSKDWPDAGEEWSAWWGDTSAFWYGGILPRIHAFVPTGTILEIAPGYGRWTQYLRSLCDRLIVVDLAERCIDHCRRRFGEDGHIQYFVNDGRSLEMIEDRSVDFVFSFDSLVHAEVDVLESYLGQLSSKLTPNGVGFVHHSNIGRYRRTVRLARSLPPWVTTRLVERGLLPDLVAWRAESVTAEMFSKLCEGAGLRCVAQEQVSWRRGFYLIDAFSVVTPVGSSWDRTPRLKRNPLFRLEAARMSSAYSSASFRPTGTP
jgi:hypothetical protein